MNQEKIQGLLKQLNIEKEIKKACSFEAGFLILTVNYCKGVITSSN